MFFTTFFRIFVAKYRHIMIGRKIEQELLQEAIDKDRAQFIVVYVHRTSLLIAYFGANIVIYLEKNMKMAKN